MQLQNSMEFIYNKCAERIKKAIEAFNGSLSDIYSDDPKILSSIQNNRRTRNNRFLVPDRVLRNYAKNDGLILKNLFKNEEEVLWGTHEEIAGYAEELFKIIFSDLQMNIIELDFNPDIILCDYIPYSKDSTVIDCLLNGCSSEFFHNAIETSFCTDIVTNKEKALQFLYKKCRTEYLSVFQSFIANINTFNKIDKVFEKDFVREKFIPILKRQIPDDNSLGLRVKMLIEKDISQAPEHITGIQDDYFLSLIDASSEYISKLEKIQVTYL